MNGDFLRKKIQKTDFQLFEIAEKLGITQQDLQSKLKSKDIKVSFLQKIATAINKNVYYFFDEDEKPNVENMYGNETTTKTTTFLPETKNVKNVVLLNPHPAGIPLIPIEAMAGWGSGSVQVMDYDLERYIVPEFTELRVDFMIQVKGSSMYPKYSSGDLVACKKLALNDIFFQWNKVYVLDTEQGALIKRIKKGNDTEHILLVSENPNYDPFELHLSEVYAVALVVGVIRLE